MIFSVLKYLALPSNLILLCLTLGSLGTILRRTRRLALWFFAVGGGVYFIFGSGPVSYWILGQLEYKYPALSSVKNNEDVEAIAVLAGYVVSDPVFPLSSRVNGPTLFRLSEAILLWRERPHSKIILIGPTDMTDVMENFLLAIGVPKSAVIKASKSRNTLENIQSLGSILNGKRIILVTSAGHMPRAVLLAKRYGLDPIPAPTDYYSSPNLFKSNWLPTPFHLELSDLAAREYLALAYYHYFQSTIETRNKN